MNHTNFQTLLASQCKDSNFQIRQTLERLREGLFDPFGVQLLTTGEENLNTVFNQTFTKNSGLNHLCVCGAYGQGKSHTLKFIEQQALDKNFVVSSINLDPVQVCFHNFNIVYRALMENMCFPGSKDSFEKMWKRRVAQWLAMPENSNKTIKDLIPDIIPHKFKSVLTAMAQKNMVIPYQKRKLKKHARFKPNSFPWILKNALLGKNIPAWRLNSVFRYREVNFYKEKSLVCKKSEEYLDLVHGMGKLFQNIGYKGWVVLFDEGESIVQNNIICRTKSYKLLHKIFYPERNIHGLFPVFAFTNDFFSQLEYEEYDRINPKKYKKNRDQEQGTMKSDENFYFDRNYHNEWKSIQKFRLHDLASQEWDILIQRIIILHGIAYHWKPSMDLMKKEINSQLVKYQSSETRLKLKLIINTLDMEQQQLS